jgi:hypothetical protein
MMFASSQRGGGFIRHIRHMSLIRLIPLIKPCAGCEDLIRRTSDAIRRKARRSTQPCWMPSDTRRMRKIDPTRKLMNLLSWLMPMCRMCRMISPPLCEKAKEHA